MRGITCQFKAKCFAQGPAPPSRQVADTALGREGGRAVGQKNQRFILPKTGL